MVEEADAIIAEIVGFDAIIAEVVGSDAIIASFVGPEDIMWGPRSVSALTG